MNTSAKYLFQSIDELVSEFSSVQLLSHVWLFFDPIECSMPGFPVHYQLLKLAQTHVHWVYDTIQKSHPLLLPSPPAFIQAFPASGSFPMSQLFASHGQSIRALVSASVLPMNIQGWFHLGLTDLISLQSKGPSRVFSSITLQKHQFSGTQPSLWSNSHIRTWLLKKTTALTIQTFVSKVMLLLSNMLSRFVSWVSVVV